MSLPIARQDGLVVRELPDETLVYDLRTNKAHCLNQAAALVWRLCDGHTALLELAAALHTELGVADGEAAARLALRQLSRRALLEQPFAVEPATEILGRREVLRKLAILGTLPIIMTIAARHAAHALSLCQDNKCREVGQRFMGGLCEQGEPLPQGTACSNTLVCDGKGNCGPRPKTTMPVSCTGECTAGTGNCSTGCKCPSGGDGACVQA